MHDQLNQAPRVERQQQLQHDHALAILRLPAVKVRTGLARSTIYDKLDQRSPRHDPTFPRPVNLGTRAIGWIEAEIIDWLVRQIEQSRYTAANTTQPIIADCRHRAIPAADSITRRPRLGRKQ